MILGFIVPSKDNTMDPFAIKRSTWKIVFVAVAAIILVALPPLTPYIPVWRVGKIPLSPLQIFYAVLSSEIVLAVYMWGVGNWSRFEPPQNASGSAARQAVQPPQGQPTTGVAAQENAPPPAQKGGD